MDIGLTLRESAGFSVGVSTERLTQVRHMSPANMAEFIRSSYEFKLCEYYHFIRNLGVGTICHCVVNDGAVFNCPLCKGTGESMEILRVFLRQCGYVVS